MIFRTMAKCSNTRKKTVNNFVRQSNYGETLMTMRQNVFNIIIRAFYIFIFRVQKNYFHNFFRYFSKKTCSFRVKRFRFNPEIRISIFISTKMKSKTGS